jgi:hypothetical protein
MEKNFLFFLKRAGFFLRVLFEVDKIGMICLTPGHACPP